MTTMLKRARDYAASFDRRLWALCAAWVLNGLGYSMVLPFLSLYLTKERGVSMSQVGTVLLVAGLFRTLGQSVGGAVVHRLGCMRAIVGSQAVQLLCYLALSGCVALRVPLAGLGALISLSYLANAVFQCGADVLTARLTGESRRVEAYGITRVGLNVGWATGPAIGAFLARTPYSLLFLLAAGVAAVNVGILAALVREPAAAPEEGASAAAGGDRARAGWAGLLRERSLLALCAVWFVLSLLMSQLVSILPVYATQSAGLSQPQLGWLYTVNGLLCIAFQIPVAAAVKRRRLTAVLSAGAAVYSLGYLSFAWRAGFPGALASICLLTVAEMAVNPAATALASMLSRPRELARNMAAFGLARALGYAAGPMIGGALFDVWKHRPLALWGTLSLFGLAAAAGFALLGRFGGKALQPQSTSFDLAHDLQHPEPVEGQSTQSHSST